MTKGFPKRLNILGYNYPVYVVKDLKDSDGTKLDGLMEVKPFRRIKIDADLSTHDKYSTLIHEAIHAILCVSGSSSIIDNENIEEGLVLALENGLTILVKELGKKLLKGLS